MRLGLEIDATSLLRAFANAPEATRRRMRIGVKQSVEEVKIQAQGVHRFVSKTGAVERSVSTRFEEPMAGVVSLDPAVPVAGFIHQGTRPHTIMPAKRKVLRWVSRGGGFAFAKRIQHPGTSADPFLHSALHAKEDRIRHIMSDAVSAALREASA